MRTYPFFLPIIDPCFLLVYFILFCAFLRRMAIILILTFRPITKKTHEKPKTRQSNSQTTTVKTTSLEINELEKSHSLEVQNNNNDNTQQQRASRILLTCYV